MGEKYMIDEFNYPYPTGNGSSKQTKYLEEIKE